MMDEHQEDHNPRDQAIQALILTLELYADEPEIQAKLQSLGWTPPNQQYEVLGFAAAKDCALFQAGHPSMTIVREAERLWRTRSAPVTVFIAKAQ